MPAIFFMVIGLATFQVAVATSGRNSDDFWKEVPGQENIVKLNEENYYDFIQNRTWVYYYNTWCPVFKGQRESIAKIATALVKMDYPGGLGAFECRGSSKNEKPICVEYRRKCWYYNVYYYGGKYIEPYPYRIKDEESSAVNFMEAHIRYPTEKLLRDRNCEPTFSF